MPSKRALNGGGRKSKQAITGMAVWTILVVAGFSVPLWRLVSFAADSSLYSHILLIPFVSAYLIWWDKSKLSLEFRPSLPLAGLAFAVGVGMLAGYGFAARSGWEPATEDFLFLTIGAFLLFLLSGALLFLGTRFLRSAAFPVAFLVFMCPLPTVVLDGIVYGLQVGSAEAAYWMLRVSGMPVLKDGTAFRLPGFEMQVAPECSGIHSTLVLFITCLVGGYVLLRSNWSRGILALFIVPLALLRNGLRIFTIGQLCVRISPDMIHHWIHRRGGPIFFVISLVPFFILLLWLRRMERRGRPAGPPASRVQPR